MSARYTIKVGTQYLAQSDAGWVYTCNVKRAAWVHFHDLEKTLGFVRVAHPDMSVTAEAIPCAPKAKVST